MGPVNIKAGAVLLFSPQLLQGGAIKAKSVHSYMYIKEISGSASQIKSETAN